MKSHWIPEITICCWWNPTKSSLNSSKSHSITIESPVSHHYQWIGLRENVQEKKTYLLWKSMVSGSDFPTKPIHWHSREISQGAPGTGQARWPNAEDRRPPGVSRCGATMLAARSTAWSRGDFSMGSMGCLSFNGEPDWKWENHDPFLSHYNIYYNIYIISHGDMARV